MKNIKLNLVCIIILIIAILTRYDIGSNHFTSWDDLYMGYISLNIAEIDKLNFLEKLKDSNFFENTYINYFPIILLKIISTPVFISLTTSTAPLQYLINPFLLISTFKVETTTYLGALFTMRFQSFLISIFFFIFYFYLSLKKITKYSEKFCLIFIGGIIFLTSWQFLILSSHGDNNASILLCAVLLILNLIYLTNSNNTKEYLYSSCVWVFLVMTNYQLLFFLPSAVLTLFFLKQNKNKNDLFNFFVLSLSILISIILIKYLLDIEALGADYVSSQGANIQKQYLFSNFKNNGIFGFTNFISSNINQISFSILASSNITQNIFNLLLFPIYFFFILGIFNLFLKNKLFFYFILFSLLTFLVLFYFSILAFSPTRHMIWMLFILGIAISYGFDFVINYFNHKKIIYFLILFLSFLNFCTFVFNYSTIKDLRKDPLINLNLKEIISENNINIIATYNLSYNFNIHPFIKKKFKLISSKNGIMLFVKKNNKFNIDEINAIIYCSNGKGCIKNKENKLIKVKKQILNFLNLETDINDFKKEKSFNLITNVYESFGNFAKSNNKIQIFEIYKFYAK